MNHQSWREAIYIGIGIGIGFVSKAAVANAVQMHFSIWVNCFSNRVILSLSRFMFESVLQYIVRICVALK